MHDPHRCQHRCTTMDGGCDCPCKPCRDNREKAFRAKRLTDLQERFRAAGIDPQDLADLLWQCVEPYYAAKIDAEVARRVTAALRSVKLESSVVFGKNGKH